MRPRDSVLSGCVLQTEVPTPVESQDTALRRRKVENGFKNRLQKARQQSKELEGWTEPEHLSTATHLGPDT